MNHRSKRLMRDLEAIGFQRDHDAKCSGIAYRHPNEPETIVKVHETMSDCGRTAVWRLAEKIADAARSGSPVPQSIKERAQITRQKDKSQRQREDEARRARAEAAEREREKQDRLEAADRHRREVESLMQPGRGR